MEKDILAELNLDQGWSISEEAFACIINLLTALKPQRIVEFGSGRSTVRLALAFPEAEILSFENSEDCALDTQQLIKTFVPQAKIQVCLQPLTKRWIAGAQYITYQKIILKKPVDVAIIDGPPGATRRGREACLYAVYPNLKIGGLVILDDYQRLPEKQIVQNWLGVFRDSFDVKILTVGHHLAVLRKTKEIKPRWFSIERLKDNWSYLYMIAVSPEVFALRLKRVIRFTKRLLSRKRW